MTSSSEHRPSRNISESATRPPSFSPSSSQQRARSSDTVASSDVPPDVRPAIDHTDTHFRIGAMPIMTSAWRIEVTSERSPKAAEFTQRSTR